MYRRNIELTYNSSWYQVILGGTYLLIAQKIFKPVAFCSWEVTKATFVGNVSAILLPKCHEMRACNAKRFKAPNDMCPQPPKIYRFLPRKTDMTMAK